jgi:hypothetical protein
VYTSVGPRRWSDAKCGIQCRLLVGKKRMAHEEHEGTRTGMQIETRREKEIAIAFLASVFAPFGFAVVFNCGSPCRALRSFAGTTPGQLNFGILTSKFGISRGRNAELRFHPLDMRASGTIGHLVTAIPASKIEVRHLRHSLQSSSSSSSAAASIVESAAEPFRPLSPGQGGGRDAVEESAMSPRTTYDRRRPGTQTHQATATLSEPDRRSRPAPAATSRHSWPRPPQLHFLRFRQVPTSRVPN